MEYARETLIEGKKGKMKELVEAWLEEQSNGFVSTLEILGTFLLKIVYKA